MPITAVVQRVLAFLRAGYPEGVPPTDYIPLIALLQRHLSEEEVVTVSAELAAAGLAGGDHAQVSDAIQAITNHAVLTADVNRVQARLASVGWDVDHDAPEQASDRPS